VNNSLTVLDFCIAAQALEEDPVCQSVRKALFYVHFLHSLTRPVGA